MSSELSGGRYSASSAAIFAARESPSFKRALPLVSVADRPLRGATSARIIQIRSHIDREAGDKCYALLYLVSNEHYDLCRAGGDFDHSFYEVDADTVVRAMADTKRERQALSALVPTGDRCSYSLRHLNGAYIGVVMDYDETSGRRFIRTICPVPDIGLSKLNMSPARLRRTALIL